MPRPCVCVLCRHRAGILTSFIIVRGRATFARKYNPGAGPAFSMLCSSFPITKGGCPILARSVRKGGMRVPSHRKLSGDFPRLGRVARTLLSACRSHPQAQGSQIPRGTGPWNPTFRKARKMGHLAITGQFLLRSWLIRRVLWSNAMASRETFATETSWSLGACVWGSAAGFAVATGC